MLCPFLGADRKPLAWVGTTRLPLSRPRERVPPGEGPLVITRPISGEAESLLSFTTFKP